MCLPSPEPMKSTNLIRNPAHLFPFDYEKLFSKLNLNSIPMVHEIFLKLI